MMEWGDGFIGFNDGILTGSFAFLRVEDRFTVGNVWEAARIIDYDYPHDHWDLKRLTAHGYTRHRRNLNVVFCDGHVEAVKTRTLFIEMSDAALRRWNKDNQPAW